MVELVIAGTIYTTFCAYLLFPHLGAPRIFSNVAIALCASEFVSAIAWGMSRQHCGGVALGGAVHSDPWPPIAGVLDSFSADPAGALFSRVGGDAGLWGR